MKLRLRYRPTRPEDLLPAMKMVMHTFNHLRKQHHMRTEPVRWREVPVFPRHLLETDSASSWCAMAGDAIVGYGHALNRGKQWYLAYLFVHPKVQDKGVGRKLLESVWRDEPGVTHSLCTFAFNPQAIGIYSQFGMSPVMDLGILTTTVGHLQKPERPGLVLSDQLSAKDLLWINQLEDEIRGYRRPEEWHLWTTDPEFKPYIFRDKGQRVAYAVVYKDVQIGPVGAISNSYQTKAVAELLNLLPADRNHPVKLTPPGSNLPLYQMLIKSGFRCEELAVFMSDNSYCDFTRYCPTHLAIF